MDAWLALDPELRTTLVGAIGLLLGALVNWAVSSLAYDPRGFSPWSQAHPRDARSPWLDRLPLVGWFRVRRQAESLGRGFWIRPLAVEAGLAASCAGLYWWEVLRGGLLSVSLGPAALADPIITYPLHCAFLSHVLLLVFMLAASLIDFDEMTIPDSITVPGTLVGLAVVTVLPWSLLPIEVHPQFGVAVLTASFGLAPGFIEQGYPNCASLAVGWGCYLVWCVGLLPRPWKTSRGYGLARRILLARMTRYEYLPRIVFLTAVGLGLITAVWMYEPVRWIGLGTSLVGLAAGGAVVWIVRNIGGWALGTEAMGFGDVTLMAMIGSFVGWQASVLIFFAAPGAALVIGGMQWLILRTNVLPYGPFLCLSTVAIVVGWSRVWAWAADRFALPWLIPGVLAVGFVLLTVVLALLRAVRNRA